MSNCRILIVDDNFVRRRSLAQQLVDAMGLSPRSAASASEAVETLAESHDRGEPFDLILLDWDMPDGSALRFIAECRYDARFVSVPTIITTNDLRKVLPALNNGATFYIVKPVSGPVLKKVISEALRQTEKRKDADL